MEFKLTIRGRLPGLNEIIDAARGSKYSGAKQKREWTAIVAATAFEARVPAITEPVEVFLAWYEPNLRRDLDNVSAATKFILDGLVVARVLRGDGRRLVRGLHHEFPPPAPRDPRVVVTLRTVEVVAR